MQRSDPSRGFFGVLCLTFSAHREALSISNSADAEARMLLPWIILASLTLAFVVFTSYAFLVLA